MKTHKERVYERLGLDPKKTYSLPALAKLSGTPLATLKKVYSRGQGAYFSGGIGGRPSASVRMKGTYKKGVDAPMSQKLSMAQWAKARVFSFLDGNPKHDMDLR